MGVNIDEILASLEQEKTAEAQFAEGLSNDSKTPESTEKTEAVSEDNAPAEETPEETTKEASAEETAPAEETAYEVSEEEAEKIAADCDAQGRIMARAFVGELNKLAADADSDESVSETSEPVSNETVQAKETESSNEAPAVKTAQASAEHIVGSLYNNFFGEEE